MMEVSMLVMSGTTLNVSFKGVGTNAVKSITTRVLTEIEVANQ
ncbi:hypothetical protein [Beggiatoa leptomitoformis]|nr:hypothetical protein [Beggiatoa leptomitoformis]